MREVSYPRRLKSKLDRCGIELRVEALIYLSERRKSKRMRKIPSAHSVKIPGEGHPPMARAI
jgi:hypothetical protein